MATAIILGAKVGPNGASPALRRRTLAGADLLRSGRVSRIIASGGRGDCAPTEAEAMFALLVELGVDTSAIQLEPASRTTYENLANSKPLIGQGPVIIVTDWYHIPRALMTARALGIVATGHRASLKGTTIRGQTLAALRECIALPVYWWHLRRNGTGRPA